MLWPTTRSSVYGSFWLTIRKSHLVVKWPLYWGRIPGVLSGMGAELYYGQQDSWARVEDNARTIRARIRQILEPPRGKLRRRVKYRPAHFVSSAASSRFASSKNRRLTSNVGSP